MSSNTLSGAGVTPANTKAQLIHIGTGIPGGSYTLRLGDGTALPVSMTSTGMEMQSLGIGSTFKSTLTTAATAARAVVLADAAGTLYPQTTRVLTATVNTATATTTTSDLTDLDFTALANGLYEVEGSLIVRSNNTTVGYTIRINGPTTTLCGLHCTVYSTDGSIITDELITALVSGTPSTMALTTSVPVANTNYLVRVRGFYKVGGTGGTFGISLTAEVNTAASFVTAEANSLITHTKRA